MYRIYDTTSAIREVQIYLGLAGNPDILVAPSGVFDENTKLSVQDFQRSENLEDTGVVDLETFNRLYETYVVLQDKDDFNNMIDSFIAFPIIPGQSSRGMAQINAILARLMDYYGFTHNLRESTFYSPETEVAVSELRKIYRLNDIGYIDEAFYIRMIKDHDSIGLFVDNFN